MSRQAGKLNCLSFNWIKSTSGHLTACGSSLEFFLRWAWQPQAAMPTAEKTVRAAAVECRFIEHVRRGVKKRENLNSYVAFCIATAMLYYGFILIDVYVQVLLYCLVLSPK